jgi:hypothetical protein
MGSGWQVALETLEALERIVRVNRELLFRALSAHYWLTFESVLKWADPIHLGACSYIFLFCKSETCLNWKIFKFEYVQNRNYTNSKSTQIQKSI